MEKNKTYVITIVEIDDNGDTEIFPYSVVHGDEEKANYMVETAFYDHLNYLLREWDADDEYTIETYFEEIRQESPTEWVAYTEQDTIRAFVKEVKVIN